MGLVNYMLAGLLGTLVAIAIWQEQVRFGGTDPAKHRTEFAAGG